METVKPFVGLVLVGKDPNEPFALGLVGEPGRLPMGRGRPCDDSDRSDRPRDFTLTYEACNLFHRLLWNTRRKSADIDDLAIGTDVCSIDVFQQAQEFHE